MTIDQPVSDFFTAGGTLPPDAPSYVKRPTDDELFRHIMAGEFCYVLTPRQMGKSSLMIQTSQRLQNQGVKSAVVDLTQIGTAANEEQWYKGILTQIKRRLRLSINPVSWWEQKRDIPNIQKFIEFFEEALSEVTEQVVIFMDEIDTTLQLDFRDNFFAGIRAIYNARADQPEFNRLTFVLLGVASPSDLIKDRTRTPFNIGQEILLKSFDRKNARILEQGLDQVYPNRGDKILDRIFYWTNGHPYLTQKLCSEIVERKNDGWSDQNIDQLVADLFLSEQARKETNLKFVQDRLLDSINRSALLNLYKKILRGRVREDGQSLLQNELKLSGLVDTENGFLRVRNRIYKTAFSYQWAQENTAKNWTRITAIASVSLSFLLLSVFITNFVVGSLSSQYAGDFYTNQSSSARLGNLARLFELHGLLTNTDYDFRARELFYSLNWNDQTKLFNDPYISPIDKQKYLMPVVEGLYVTMADIDGEQENSDLLGFMRDSLKDVKTQKSSDLQNEINLWLEARIATNNQNALDKYDDVIKANQNNPATHYERALIAIQLGQYDQALIDLDATMGLAQNISSEASEKEIATPTQRPTRIPIQLTSTTVVDTSHPITETPQLQTPQPQSVMATTNSNEIVETPPLIATQLPEATPTSTLPREGYKSSFYSIAYIRSAIDLVIQENNGKPNFDSTLAVNFSKLTNLNNAGLINIDLTLRLIERFATESAIAQAPTKNPFTESSTLVANTSTPIPGEVTNINSNQLVLVPAGDFIMGSDDGNVDEKPAHTVFLDTYYIDKYEVINALYKQCVDSGTCPLPQKTSSTTRSDYFGNSLYADYPVLYVNWYGAKTFCEWRGLRLPTEAEWEKAARGTDGLTYPWGDQIDCSKANYENCTGDTTKVGSYESGKSIYGVYDMAGNVWEWVSSQKLPYPYNVSDGREASPTSNNDERALHGGAWNYPSEIARSSQRFALQPLANYSNFGSDVGFRCASSISEFPLTTSSITPVLTETASVLNPTFSESTAIPAVCDDFNSNQLNPQWLWVNPLGDAEYSLTEIPGFLSLKVKGRNHDLYQNLNAPRLILPVNGNFVIETKLDINPARNYQGAGLLLWHDSDNYVRLERTLVKGIDILYRVAGIYRAIEISYSERSTTIHLQMELVSNNLSTRYSNDGITWIDAATIEVLNNSNNFVGLDLVNEWQDGAITADFDYFYMNDCKQ